MSAHSIAEAKAKLATLIDRALNGEDVVITRDGRAVVALRPVETKASRVSAAESLAWLRAHRVQPGTPPEEDAGTFVSRMRDEEQRS